ncbi:MAG: hypothetical protein ACRD0A_03000 [Acidimicrobiales bacterium]
MLAGDGPRPADDGVTLPGLTPPATPGAPQSLTGEFVALGELSSPTVGGPTAALPSGNSSFSAPTDDFGAVNTYYSTDRVFRFMLDELGIDVGTFFVDSAFPLTVDHRDSSLGVVNARGYGSGTATLELRARLPRFLVERGWELRFANPGGGRFTLGPRAERTVVLDLRPGRDFAAAEVSAKDPDISVSTAIDGMAVGGMTWRVDAGLRRPPRQQAGDPQEAKGKGAGCRASAERLLDCLDLPSDGQGGAGPAHHGRHRRRRRLPTATITRRRWRRSCPAGVVRRRGTTRPGPVFGADHVHGD